FVTALVSAMGVKIPARWAPMMVVDIDPRPVVKLEPPPPPLRLESPKIAMTLPTMPEVIMELPPPATAPKTAISIAAPDTIPFDTRASGEKYETVMLRYINSHLRYPPIARARHQQGTVYVRFVIDRQGHVLSAAVEKSSRVAALDEEGLALLERAQPLPAPPAEIVGDHIQLVVPINFLLR
ncbi:MAG: energy transducer TonB, partial [Candidatus Binataceae bacterium]